MVGAGIFKNVVKDVSREFDEFRVNTICLWGF